MFQFFGKIFGLLISIFNCIVTGCNTSVRRLLFFVDNQLCSGARYDRAAMGKMGGKGRTYRTVAFLLRLGGTSIETNDDLEPWENVRTRPGRLDERIGEKTAHDESFDLILLEEKGTKFGLSVHNLFPRRRARLDFIDEPVVPCAFDE